MLLCGLALRVVQANDVQRRRAFRTYLGLRLLTTAVALLGIGLIVVIAGYGRALSGVVLLVGIAKAAEAISEVFWAQLQQQEQMAPIGTSMILKGVLSVAAVGAVLGTLGNLTIATLAFAATWIAALLVYDLPVGRRMIPQTLRPSFQCAALLDLARLAFPLGIVLMLSSLALNVPRYFLVHHHDEHALGMFSAISNLMLVGMTLMTALGQAAAPRLARHFANQDRAGVIHLVVKLLGVSVALGICGIVLAVVAGRFILTIVYTLEYAAAVDVLVLAMIAALASYVSNVFAAVAIAAGEFRIPVPLQCVNLLTTTIIAWLAIPSHGMVGAAWALVGSNVVTALAFGWLAHHCVGRMGAIGVQNV